MAQTTLSINASLNIQQVLASIKQIRNGLDTLTLPKGLDKQFDSAATKLEKSLNELSTFSGRELKVDEAKQALKIIQDIQKAGVSFQGILNNIGGLDLKNIQLSSFVEDLNKINEAMNKYEQSIENIKKSQAYTQKQSEFNVQEKRYRDSIKASERIDIAIANSKISIEGYNETLTNLSKASENIDKSFTWLNNLKTLKEYESRATTDSSIAKILGFDESILKGQITRTSNLLQKQFGTFDTSNLLNLRNNIANFFSKNGATEENFNKLFQGSFTYNESNVKAINEQAAAFQKLIALIDIYNAKTQNKDLEQNNKIVQELAARVKTEQQINEEISKRKTAQEKISRKEKTARESETTEKERLNKLQINQKNQDKITLDAQTKMNQIKAEMDALITGPNSSAMSAWQQLLDIFKSVGGDTTGLDKNLANIDELKNRLSQLSSDKVDEIRKKLDQVKDSSKNAADGVTKLGNSGNNLKGAVANTEQFNRELGMMQNRIQYFFGLNNSIQLLKRGLREAYNTVKELDSAMTETAVVTDFTVSDMWDQLPLYTKTANELGATTLGAYQTMTLFYQQGLKTNEAFQLGTETMKMARIANMEYATATDMMTAALRGFNMTLNETSAKRVNDVYSELAAITAADTEEIATAMTKTASIANSASMEFETTAAFLSQIIETTREAPETAGTALKTIIARFTEVKQLYSKGQLTGEDSEGEAININKIDAALQSVGLSLKGFLRGEEGLDDILLQLASKWDTLDIATQRYIATMAAGSRQQSRFLAMMSDYDRTLELVEAANNSAGASDRQFEKTLDSLESKLNKLSNAWDQFTMGLADNKLIKGAVDALTALLDVINKLTNLPGGGLLKIMLGMSALRGGGTLLQTGVNWLAGTLTGGAAPGKGAMYTTLQQAGVPNLEQAAASGEVGKLYKATLARQFMGPFYGLGGRISDAWKGFKENKNLNAASFSEENFLNNLMYGNRNPEMNLLGFWGKFGNKLVDKGLFTGKLSQFLAKKGPFAALSKALTGIPAEATAAGTALAGLAGALTAIAAVAAAIAIGIKIYDVNNISTKEAQENASNLAEAKTTAKENKDSYDEQIKNYKELQKTLKETTKGTSDWNDALTENNDAVLQMASQFSDLSYEVDSTTGALQLTEESQKAVSEQLESGTKTTNIASALAESYSLSRQAKDKMSQSYIASAGGPDVGGNYAGPSEQDLIKADSLKNEAKSLENQARAQFENAINQMDLGSSEATKNLSSIVSQQVLTDYNNAIEEASKKYKGKTNDELYSALSDMYGLTEDQTKEIFGDEDLFDEEFARIALATGEVATGEGGLQDQLSTLVNNLNNLYNISSDQVGTLNQVLSGVSDVDLSNLEGITKDDIASYLNALYEGEELTEKTAQFYSNLYSNIANQALKTAIANDAIGNTAFKKLSSELQLDLADLLTNVQTTFGEIGVKQLAQIFSKLNNDELAQTATDIISAYNKINFSKPISAFKQIQRYTNSSNKSIAALGNTLLEMENADAVFGTTAQFGYLYENIFSSDENIQNLLDDLGDLDADDIYDLADSFSEVEDFINESKVTASGLAKVLNEINNNGLNANLVDKGFLEAMSQANSYTSNMLDTINKLDDIDLGTDFGQVADTFKDWAEQWKEMINNGELGNQQVAKMYDFFRGTGSWAKIASQGIDVVKAEAIDFYNTLNSISERGDMAMIWKDILGADGITGKDLNFSAVWDEANQQVLWEIKNGASYDEIAAEVKKKLSDAGLSEELVPYLLTDAANFSLGLAQLVDSQGFESALNILFDSIKESGKKVVDQAQLDAIINSANDQEAARKFAEEMMDKYDFTADEWTGETLFKGLEAGFNQATKEVNGYEKALADTFKEVSQGDSKVLQFDLAEALNYANLEDILTQLPEIAGGASAEAVEIISGEFKGLTINWEDVFNNFDGDLGRYLNAQVELKQMQQYADVLTEALNGAIVKFEGSIDGSLIKSEDIKNTISSAISSGIPESINIPLKVGSAGASVTIGGTSIPVVIKPSEAKGGYVPSYATGSEGNKLSKGVALTGEEAPEIVWNKEKGYAYLAGANGPEYNNLQPGDRVFNAEETKKILRNSKRNKRPSLANGGLITPSYDEGTSTPSYKEKNWIGGGSSTTTSKEEDKDKWKNEFDWLYNLLEDITELEREQNKLNEKYEDYLEDINKTAADLVKITTQELSNLYAQQARQQLAYDKRIQEMNEYLAANAEFAQYGTYNFDDMTIEIDWDAIEAVQDQELYDKIEDYVDGLEDIQDKLDEADDALIDIENDIQDLQQRFQEEYIDFENRILDAIVNSRKQQIDQLSDINDSIKDTNSKLLDAVQKSLEQQRQDRENQKTEDEIAEKERRLSFLRQDTSNDNTLDILALEDELKDLKEDYTDELIDQKLTLLQDQEDFAAEQRERQISLMESQLDYDKETGQLWEEVNTLIQNSIGSDGKLINDSALANLLRDTENWSSLSDVQKQLWEDTLITDFNTAYAYVLMQGVDQVKLKMDEITNMMDTIAKSLPNYSQAKEKNATDSSSGGGGGSSGGTGGPYVEPPKTETSTVSKPGVTQKWGLYIGGSLKNTYTSQSAATSALNTMKNAAQSEVSKKFSTYLKTPAIPKSKKDAALSDYNNAVSYLDSLSKAIIKIIPISSSGGGGQNSSTLMAYATGGLNTTTGPAWLDGTKSKPELVLNAKDTQNFLALKDILSDVMQSPTSTDGNSQKGDTYIDISIQAELSNDYDVEQLTKKIKDEIYKDGSYRGVNIIRKIR